MSQDQTRRILEAIAECEKFIAKEEARRADIRPADVQQHLEFCIAHRVKLAAMIEAA